VELVRARIPVPALPFVRPANEFVVSFGRVRRGSPQVRCEFGHIGVPWRWE
jgi:hypothetical protein